MKNSLRILAVGTAILCGTVFSTSAVHAAGFGAYFDYGSSSVSLEGSPRFDLDRYGVGFILDTATARDKLFNYRMTVGYEHLSDDFGFSSNGLATNHTFGFGILRRPGFRLWAGPMLGLTVGFESLDAFALGSTDDVNISVGGGPQVGFNWHIGDRMSLSAAVSYQYQYIAFLESGSTPDGSDHLIRVNLSLLFRTSGDRFDAP